MGWCTHCVLRLRTLIGFPYLVKYPSICHTQVKEVQVENSTRQSPNCKNIYIYAQAPTLAVPTISSDGSILFTVGLYLTQKTCFYSTGFLHEMFRQLGWVQWKVDSIICCQAFQSLTARKKGMWNNYQRICWRRNYQNYCSGITEDWFCRRIANSITNKASLSTQP